MLDPVSIVNLPEEIKN